MSLYDVFKICLRRLWIVIAVTLIVFLTGYYIEKTNVSQTVTYKATKMMTMTVDASKGDVNISSNTLNYITSMLDNGMSIWNNDGFYEVVTQVMNEKFPDAVDNVEGFGVGYVRSNLRVEKTTGMNFNVVATSTDEEMCVSLVKCAAQSYDKTVNDKVVKTNLLNEYFKGYDTMYNPMLVHDGLNNTTDNISVATSVDGEGIGNLFYLMIGLALGIICAALAELAMPKLQDSDRVAEVLEVPCIGEYHIGREDRDEE